MKENDMVGVRLGNREIAYVDREKLAKRLQKGQKAALKVGLKPTELDTLATYLTVSDQLAISS